MKRVVSLFGAGVAVFFVMFFAAPTARPARAADPAQLPASAPTAAQKAKQHYQQGEAYFKSKNFSEAMDEYQKGYLERPDSVFIFNIAQCQRLLGHRESAVEFYQRYLREAPDGAGRAVAERQIAALSAPPANVSAAAAGAALSPPTPAGSTTAPVAAAPGNRPGAAPEPAASAPGAGAAPPVQTAPAAPAAGPALASASALATPAPEAPVLLTARAAEPQRPVYERWWFWTAAAAVVVGTVIAVSASSPSRPDCGAGRICK